jgi:ribosomal subunit interface protein
MEVRVSGHRVDTGEALKTHVDARIKGLTNKYFSRAHSAQVTFGKGPHDHGFICDIVAHVMHGVILKGSGGAPDAHPAFEAAADKIEKQLRRYKRRLRDHHVGNHLGNGAAAASSDFATGPDFEAAYTVFDAGSEEEEAADNPLIVAETRVDVPDATVSDAVMMMDLRNTAALLFRNTASGVYNMVYRRGDGTIGWVEPPRSK